MSNSQPSDIAYALRTEPIFEGGRRPIMPASAAEIAGHRPGERFAFTPDNDREPIERARRLLEAVRHVGPLPYPPARETSGSSPPPQLGSLVAEAVIKQCDAAADQIVKAGLLACDLAHKLRDHADDLAEQLRAQGKILSGTIEQFATLAAGLDAAFRAHKAEVVAFRPRLETTD